MENRIERAFRATHATEGSRKTTSSIFEPPTWSPRPLRGASGGRLERLWDPPGRQLDPLGAPLGPPWELRGRSWALLARSWRRFFAQILETSSVGPDFPRFGLRLGTKTSEILTKTYEIIAKT